MGGLLVPRVDGLTGIFDNEDLQQRELWRDGWQVRVVTRVDLETPAVVRHFSGSVPKFGSFPPLPADLTLQ